MSSRALGTPPMNRPLPRDQQRSRLVPLLEASALGGVGMALGIGALVLLVVPQRIAQRPAAEGVITVGVDAAGGLRVWNQPIRPQDLPGLLHRAAEKGGRSRFGAVTLRLVPDAAVPWGVVQGLVNRLERPGLALELQLP